MSTGPDTRDSIGCIRNYDICARARSSFTPPVLGGGGGGGGGGGVLFKPLEQLS